MTESVIQQKICSHLSSEGYFYFAPLNETAQMIMKIFKVPDSVCARIVNFLKKMGLTPGIPDLVVCLENGRVIFLEIKTAKTGLTGSQPFIHLALQKLGHTVYIVRSVEDVIKIMEVID